MTRGKSIRLAISLIIALSFAWLVARQVNGAALAQALSGTQPQWIAAGLAFTIGYSCRIARWRAMLRPANPALRWRDCAGPLLGSFAVNNLVPLRAGDLLRVVGFTRRLGVSAGVVMATVFIERLLDLLLMLALLGAALLAFRLDAHNIAGIGGFALLGIAALILAVLLFPQAFAPLARACACLLTRFSPRLGARLAQEIEHGLVTLLSLSRGTMMLRLVGWSLAAWLAEGCLFWFTALALPAVTMPAAGWLALPVGTLATLIPGTPGYVGTFDYFTVQAMTALGNSDAAATAYALLVHLLLWLAPTLIGGLYLVLHPPKTSS